VSELGETDGHAQSLVRGRGDRIREKVQECSKRQCEEEGRWGSRSLIDVKAAGGAPNRIEQRHTQKAADQRLVWRQGA